MDLIDGRGAVSFSDRLGLLRGKSATEKQRRRCGLYLIKQNIDQTLFDTEVRQAIVSAKCFINGSIGKHELSQARRRIAKRIPFQSAEWNSQRHVIHAAWIVTANPFSACDVNAIGAHVAHVVATTRRGQEPRTGWYTHSDPAYSDYIAVFGMLAEQLVPFVAPRARRTIAQVKRLPADRLDDSRFQGVYLPVPRSREWILTHVKKKEQRSVGIGALDAFGRIQHRGDIGQADLKPITRSALASLRSIREDAIRMLLLIGREFDAARNALLQVFASRNAEVRFTLVSEFGYWRLQFPESFVRGFLARALQDESPRVRMFAAEGCNGYERNDLLPLMRTASDKETDPGTKCHIETSIRLLADGYYVDDRGTGDVFVWAKTNRGTSGQPVSRSDFSRKNVQKIVKKIMQEEAISDE
ncbi:MAG: HEAT repeat domain-containing protein [Planctomycetes bacterium]|nr:HEAT repeat domain-containing protein [Planctomycetota bacterium]